MRKSSIQVMRKTRKSSLDQSTTLNQDASYEKFQTSKFVHRLTLKQMGRVASEKILDRLESDKVIEQPKVSGWSEKRIEEMKKVKIPEYDFLKNKKEVQTDPFLRAKMRYLEAKEKPNLIKQMPKVRFVQPHKRSVPDNENQKGEFTTLKKEFTRQNNKKLYLLTVASSKQIQVNP